MDSRRRQKTIRSRGISAAIHNGPLHKNAEGCDKRSDCGFGYRVLARLSIEIGAGFAPITGLVVSTITCPTKAYSVARTRGSITSGFAIITVSSGDPDFTTRSAARRKTSTAKHYHSCESGLAIFAPLGTAQGVTLKKQDISMALAVHSVERSW
jgi:hypothetical protein